MRQAVKSRMKIHLIVLLTNLTDIFELVLVQRVFGIPN